MLYENECVPDQARDKHGACLYKIRLAGRERISVPVSVPVSVGRTSFPDQQAEDQIESIARFISEQQLRNGDEVEPVLKKDLPWSWASMAVGAAVGAATVGVAWFAATRTKTQDRDKDV